MPARLFARLFVCLSAFVVAFAFTAASVDDAAVNAASAIHPTVSDYVQITSSATPPTEAQCYSAGRRCFTPTSTRAAYNVQGLIDSHLDGRGMTIAIVDSHGSDTIAQIPISMMMIAITQAKIGRSMKSFDMR